MKKALMIIGIILLSAAALCFLIALFYHHMHGSVLDGSANLYARLYGRYLLFLRIGIGLGAAGTLSLAASLLMKRK